LIFYSTEISRHNEYEEHDVYQLLETRSFRFGQQRMCLEMDSDGVNSRNQA